MFVKVKLLDERAKLPEKKSEYAAAFDIYALEDTILEPFKVTKVRTGIAVEVPTGYKGEVYTRSGYGAKGIFIVNQPGKIDSDYRGEVFALLMYIPQNFNKILSEIIAWIRTPTELKSEPRKLEYYKISAGDRIAQFEIQEVIDTTLIEYDELTETERGEGGIGSTGR